MSTTKVEWRKWAPGYEAMRSLNRAVQESGLEPKLLELVKIRASQINGCAYCLDMHTKDARALGETEQRIHTLPAWREMSIYDERERAALAYTEAVTTVADRHVPDDVLEQVAAVFDEAERSHLLWAIVAINAWNRLAIGGRAPVPGSYEVAAHG
jgi:AhpD family alkylhydroperoxidase